MLCVLNIKPHLSSQYLRLCTNIGYLQGRIISILSEVRQATAAKISKAAFAILVFLKKIFNYNSHKKGNFTTIKDSVHGIRNASLHCYASSVYQLVMNIPSLKRKIIDNLPSSPLQDYDNITHSRQVIDAINQLPNPSNKPTLDSTTTGSSLDVLERLLEAANYDGFHITHHKQDKIYHRACQMLYISPKTDADFNKNFSAYFNVSIKQKNHAKISTQRYFKEVPKQLLVIPIRKSSADKITWEPQINIPLTLDLSTYHALPKDHPKSVLELTGFTAYYGNNATPGHFMAYFKKIDPVTQESQWFCANDSLVQKVDVSTITQELTHANELVYSCDH